MTNTTLPPTISVEQAGELLGVSRRSAYRAAARGQIPTVRIGRRLLVPTQRLLVLLGLDTPSPAMFSTGTETFPALGAVPAQDGAELPDTKVGAIHEAR